MNFSIPDKTKIILKTLSDNGYKAFIVGGCIRDMIMGKIPYDYDISTNALPNEIKNCFFKNKIITDGEKHGTVAIIKGKNVYEITTFRTETGYSDHRHPDSVKFCDSPLEDLRRRDFTINSIAYNETDGILDPFGGVSDISQKTIRCTGVPNDRFREDALRIMRALRFSSALGFEIEKDTALAMRKNAALLKDISAERISAEFCKMLMGSNIYAVLTEYADILSNVIPELSQSIGFDQKRKTHSLTLLEHLAKSVASAPYDIDIRLTLLMHDISKPQCMTIDEEGIAHFRGHHKLSADIAVKNLTALKLPSKSIQKIKLLILNHDNPVPKSARDIRRYLRVLGVSLFRNLLEVKTADIKAHSEDYLYLLDEIKTAYKLLDEVIENGECFSLRNLKINGNDLINDGYIKKTKFSYVLNRLLTMVIENPSLNNKETLLEISRKIA